MGLRVRPAEPSAAYPGPTKYEGFKKNVLRARRTRGPKMAKIQNSKNPIRSAQNVGQVPISMGDGFKNQKRVILDQKSRDIKNAKNWDPGPSLLSPLGGLLVSKVLTVRYLWISLESSCVSATL